jgi:rhamnopyranosyl-N-acetylglucosaminyl-diphospho-decaprenol beta-1,3/1,4-galactofuranosyltransferase
MNKIAAVVVTYNRKDCLINCLKAIRLQTLPPDIIYIIDNHSTDGTADILFREQYIDTIPNENDKTEDSIISYQINSLGETSGTILIKYIYKMENTGGAGGFYTGMQMAYDDGYEWFWMMDDDGIPAEDGLEQLLFMATKYMVHFANALVIDIDDRISLSFGLVKDKNTIDGYKDSDIVYNTINPFNGSFINRIVPEKIGFIKKEMFIWGDEVEYWKRAMDNNFTVGTIVKSIHYHPKAKGEAVNVFPLFKRLKVVIKSENLAHYYYRNLGYNNMTYDKKRFYPVMILYSIYFLSRLKLHECKTFIVNYINGGKNKYD